MNDIHDFLNGEKYVYITHKGRDSFEQLLSECIYYILNKDIELNLDVLNESSRFENHSYVRIIGNKLVFNHDAKMIDSKDVVFLSKREFNLRKGDICFYYDDDFTHEEICESRSKPRQAIGFFLGTDVDNEGMIVKNIYTNQLYITKNVYEVDISIKGKVHL